jgi:hypothetical protein
MRIIDISRAGIDANAILGDDECANKTAGRRDEANTAAVNKRKGCLRNWLFGLPRLGPKHVIPGAVGLWCVNAHDSGGARTVRVSQGGDLRRHRNTIPHEHSQEAKPGSCGISDACVVTPR